MAQISWNGRTVQVRFSVPERLVTWRPEVQVDAAAVRSVDLVERPLDAVRGGRSGFLVSGLIKVGRWGLGTGTRQLVSVRRGVPAVRIRVDHAISDDRFDELLISTDRATELVATLRGRIGAAQQ